METKRIKESYFHILKYTGLFGGVQGLNILISLVRNKIVAVLLGPYGMGLVALFNSVISLVSQGTSLGLSFSAVRHISEIFESGDNERIEHFVKVVRMWSLFAAMLGMSICIFMGPILDDYTFSWGNHTLHFILLAPVVGMMAITGGETAILKGCRKLKSLAITQVWTMLSALIIAAPIYYFFGESGIVPVFVLSALAAMIIVIIFSYRLYPLRLMGFKDTLKEGLPMVKLGLAFVLGAVFGAGADVVIRSYLNIEAGLDVLGLYNAGYMITITYSGMVFTAMETDFFPRLSAVHNNVEEVNRLVNRQIEVSLLIISPLLTMMIIFLPVIVPLLLAPTFNAVIPMAQLAVLSMFFKAITLPIAYINLAKGNSLAFLIFEAIYAIAFVLLIIVGYDYWGLLGTAAALVAVHVLDLIMIYTFARIKYEYNISRAVCIYILVFIPFGIAAYCITFIDNLLAYVLCGGVVMLLCLLISLRIISTKTSLVWKFFSRFGMRR